MKITCFKELTKAVEDLPVLSGQKSSFDRTILELLSEEIVRINAEISGSSGLELNYLKDLLVDVESAYDAVLKDLELTAVDSFIISSIFTAQACDGA